MNSRKIDRKRGITFVFNSDDGVDDALAQLLVLAQQKVTNNMVVAGIVPTVGNAILGQTEDNVRRILELVGEKNIPVFPGAITPLGLEKNVSEIDSAINATHFYGHDGLSDLPPQSWPVITIPLQKKKGYEFIADLVMDASPENPIILVSTASLTEIYKALCRMDELCAEFMLPPGCYGGNLIIVAMGGIIDLQNGPNAPFDRPDYNNKTCTPNNPPCKDAEANFYWDTPATQGVFNRITKYNIKMQLIPLDLTQQPCLLWTKAEVAGLRSIPNRVAFQIANMTDVVPWIDAKHFPQGTYPWHDGLTSAWILWGETFFTKTPASIRIGDHGQTLLDNNPLAKPNVDLIGIRPEKAAECMKKVIELFKNFNLISEIKKERSFPPLNTIFSELHPISKMSEKETNLLSLSDDLLETSNSPHLKIPLVWRAVGKLSNEINQQGNLLIKNVHRFFNSESENTQTSGSVYLNTEEAPCYYSDGTTNILDQSGQQPTHAMIGQCTLPPLEFLEKEARAKIASGGFLNGFKTGLIHHSVTQIFRHQGQSESQIEIAVEGMIAASIAKASIPAAVLYIAVNHIPGIQFNKHEKQLLAGFVFFASALSNPLNTFTSSLMLIAGYQLASWFVDSVTDLLTAGKSISHYIK